MPRLLVAAFGAEGRTYVHGAQQIGMTVQVLDCFEDAHARLKKLYGTLLLPAPGRRSDVARAVASGRFDAAIVHENSADFIRSALITQSLRESGIRHIVVVTEDAHRTSMYRRCGAHRVVVATPDADTWRAVLSGLPSFASA